VAQPAASGEVSTGEVSNSSVAGFVILGPEERQQKGDRLEER
jgi:hypothetical protein